MDEKTSVEINTKSISELLHMLTKCNNYVSYTSNILNSKNFDKIGTVQSRELLKISLNKLIFSIKCVLADTKLVDDSKE